MDMNPWFLSKNYLTLVERNKGSLNLRVQLNIKVPRV